MSEKNNSNLRAWLGFRKPFDYSEAKWFGPILAGAIVTLVGTLFLLAIAAAFKLLGGAVFGDLPSTTGRSLGVGAVTVALIGAPFVIWRAIVAQNTIDVQEQGQITDRINKAVEGLGAEKERNWIGRPIRVWTGDSSSGQKSYLSERDIKLPKLSIEVGREKGADHFYDELRGDYVEQECGLVNFKTWPDEKSMIEKQGIPPEISSGDYIASTGDWTVFTSTEPNLEVRIGALYALERISQDSERDHIQVMELLCAYIRENAPLTNLVPTEDLKTRPKLRIDIQTAISVIGRRSEERKSLEAQKKYRLDLRDTDLSGCNFSKLDFSAAKLHTCRIEAALFCETQLRGTEFFGSLLNHSDFFKAEMRGTRLERVTINRPLPILGGVNDTLNMANFYGITLGGADLTAVDYLGEPNELLLTFGTKDTILYDELDDVRNKAVSQQKRIKLRKAERDGNTELANNLRKELEASGYVNWLPFGLSDMATGHELDKFFRKLGLVGFPYNDK